MRHCARWCRGSQMKNLTMNVRLYLSMFSFFVLVLVASRPLVAQTPLVDNVVQTDAISTQLPALTSSELQELVGPIALYPDNLLAIILPASTYPLQIVLAARFLDQLESDSTLIPDETWDESVTALLNYPEVVQMMNENIDWTWQLGEAVVSQETDVLNAVSAFRDLAYVAGNLNSDDYQNVTSNDDTISITQVNEKIIYVPYYAPEEVIVYQTRPVYYYYPTAYPVYYYPYPYGHSFVSGYFWGVTTAFALSWSDHHLHVYHPSYFRHPYYGHHYDSRHYYRQPSIRTFNRSYVDNNRRIVGNRYRDGSYWRPQNNSGARPNDLRNRRPANSTLSTRSVSNDRQGNRRLNNNSGARSEQRATAAIRNNNRSNQTSRNSSVRQNNRQQTGRTSGLVTNSLTNSTTSANNRVRAQRSANPSAVDSNRRSNRIVNQLRNNSNSSTSRTTANRQSSSRVNSMRGQTNITQSRQNSTDNGRANRVRDTANRSARVAPAQSRSRAVRQTSTRQRSVPQSRNTQPSRTASRSSTPSASTSARASSSSRNVQSSSRAAGNSNRGSGGVGRRGRRVQ